MDSIINFKRKDSEDFYVILGCDELSSTEQINTEYKMRVLDCHPDKHPNDPNAAERFTILQCAKEVLCDPGKRAHYDKWRNSGLAMSYDNWLSMKDTVHTSMHWATKTKKEPMIESSCDHGACASSEGSNDSNKPVWHSGQSSDLLKKFRNYEI